MYTVRTTRTPTVRTTTAPTVPTTGPGNPTIPRSGPGSGGGTILTDPSPTTMIGPTTTTTSPTFQTGSPSIFRRLNDGILDRIRPRWDWDSLIRRIDSKETPDVDENGNPIRTAVGEVVTGPAPIMPVFETPPPANTLEAVERRLAQDESQRVYSPEYISMLSQDVMGQQGPRGPAQDAPAWLGGTGGSGGGTGGDGGGTGGDGGGTGDGGDMFSGQVGADLSKPHYKDPTTAESGEEIYLSQEYGGAQPGNYTVSVRTEGIREGSDPGTITGETRIRTYLIAPDGTEKLIKTDNKKASDNWDWWDNPLNPLSWFN